MIKISPQLSGDKRT